ncbi:PREDICTED: ejaculatory bulb-specific protein 3-like [Habropoda laboriosa]|uniref:ejaculatory bulb-specific protein 3-like n=1 Tax=Habropoda laboriosa TaxID=597456 RepID=UPI00083D39E5|nr:PREDICTED: ejaculatory bulb-specific protein 3-like [Habropoda laboriosa]
MTEEVSSTASLLCLLGKTQDRIPNLLMNKQYVEKQIDCILDRGHCDAIGRKIKELLPEAINNYCRRCTSREVAQARTLITFMQQNYPQAWNLILRRYAAMQRYFN